MLHILFLEGFADLGHNYVGDLEELGYKVIDCSTIFKTYAEEHCQLNRFSDSEKKWFLRWLVIEDIFGHVPVIHYDGDIVFNEIPETIEKQLGEFTFVLQGCPAFVSTGSSDWFAQYRKHFLKFVRDIDTYSAAAWKERQGWEKSYMDKWSGCRFRKVIESDQDFISHLIHTDRLPQDSPSAIKKNTDLILFENLLEFSDFYGELVPIAYERTNGVDYFNGKKFAFWHMQTDVIHYLQCVRRRGFMSRISRYKSHFSEQSVEHLFWRAYDRFFLTGQTRLEVYKYYFESNDFSGVLNEKTYWKDNIFR